MEKANIPFALLHTTNLYPTPAHLVRLGGMLELEENFPNAIIGLSDHTVNNNACLAATALGASILERHFTDTKRRKGPDIVNSMNPKELKELIESSEEIYKMLGGKKEAALEEQVTIDFAFATVVTIKDVLPGDTLTEENIWVKRPGAGEIKAVDYDNLIGKKAKNKVVSGKHLKWADIDL
jgi:N-acetylneuraminate synthase